MGWYFLMQGPTTSWNSFMYWSFSTPSWRGTFREWWAPRLDGFMGPVLSRAPVPGKKLSLSYL